MRLPFRLTNAGTIVQRNIDTFTLDNHLKDTFANLDDLSVCGYDQEEHHRNLANFMRAAEQHNLTLHHSMLILVKSHFWVTSSAMVPSVQIQYALSHY